MTKYVLCACEESQTVCSAFRSLGFEAFSCDVLPCSGGHPEWHILHDVLPLLNGRCSFITMDGQYHQIDGRWDMIIAFPPCTHLASSGARWFEGKRSCGQQLNSIRFFASILVADCERIAIENPVGIISGNYILEYFPQLCQEFGFPLKPTQIIQPWQFGHGEVKATCLWLKNLSPLVPTCLVDGREQRIWKLPPGPDRAKIRSKTFPGIGFAMATQWGSLL